MKTIYPLIKITWDDSITDDGRWKFIEDVIEWSDDITSIGVTVGHLLFEDDNYYVIALSVMYQSKEQTHSTTQAHNVLRIPKAVVTEIKVLEKC